MQQEDLYLKPPSTDWNVGPEIWDEFVLENNILGLRTGRWGFHNFLRNHRQALIAADAIRLAKRKFWIAHRERFARVSFELLTGKQPSCITAVNVSLADLIQEKA